LPVDGAPIAMKEEGQEFRVFADLYFPFPPQRFSVVEALDSNVKALKRSIARQIKAYPEMFYLSLFPSKEPLAQNEESPLSDFFKPQNSPFVVQLHRSEQLKVSHNPFPFSHFSGIGNNSVTKRKVCP
jgi:hypothetical protein